MNPSQEAALTRAYLPLVARHGLPLPTLPRVPKTLATTDRVAELLAELETSEAEVVVLLGDEPIRWFLRHFDGGVRNLRALGTTDATYAHKRRVTIGSRDRWVISLVHPRQAARLGSSSSEWAAVHASWIARAPGLQ